MLNILVIYLSYKRKNPHYFSIHKKLYPCRWTNLFIHAHVEKEKYFEGKS